MKIFVSSISIYRNVYFDHNSRVMLCEIPKVASSTWLAVMFNNTEWGKSFGIEKLQSHGFVHNPKFKKFLNSEGKYDPVKHANYTKFMIVRHPFDRVISAYKNKAHRTRFWNGKMNDLYEDIRNYTVTTFKHPNLTAQQRGEYVPTFPEFVDFSLYRDDKHWRSYQHFCDPCQVQYDYILRLETMQRDSEVFMSEVYPAAGPIPVSNPSQTKDNSSTDWVSPKTLEMFSQLSEETLKKLYNKYAFDLEFYGYSFNRETFAAECKFGDINCC